MLEFRIPEELWQYSVIDLNLSVRARNSLLKYGYETLGDLHGVLLDDIHALRGVGAGTVAEIVEEVAFTERVAPHYESGAAEGLRDGAVGSPFPVDIPPPLRLTPISRLSLSRWTLSALTDLGIRTLGDLQAVEWIDGAPRHLAPDQADVLLEHLRLLLGLPLPFLQEISQRSEEGELLLPDLALETIEHLRWARCLENEVRALVTGMTDRNAALVLSRWCFFGPDRPMLEDLGADCGLTRERVRQIVTREDKRLERAGLRLRIASAYVEAVECAGGAVAAQQLEGVLASAGLPTEGQPLHTLPRLAALGLTPPVRYFAEAQLWLSESGEHRYGSAEAMEWLLSERTRKVRKQVSRRTAIAVERLEALSPFGAEHMLQLVRPDATEFVEVSGYVVPLPTRHSPVITAVDKVLAVVPTIRIGSLYRGLRRMPRLHVPPVEVLSVVLANHGRYVLEGERLSPQTPLDRATVLSGSEQLGVRIFEDHAGVITQQAFLDAIVAGGYSVPMANVLLRSPYIRRVSTGVYALRGRAVDPDAMRTVLELRRKSRGDHMVSERWVGDSLIVRYRLTHFSRRGVLAKPRELSSIVLRWHSRYPDGTTGELKMRNGFLWSIRDWISRSSLQEGDLLIATFYPAEQSVEWDSVAGRDEP